MARKPALSPEDFRSEALATALTTIERKHGQGAVMRLEDSAHVKIASIPTGSIGLDLALGIGGIPKGASPKFTARNPRAKQRWPCTSSPNPKNSAARPRLSTPNTRLTSTTPGAWV